LPHRAPGTQDTPGKSRPPFLSGKPIHNYRPQGSAEIRHLIDEGFQAFNAGRLSEACHIFAGKMLAPENDVTIGLTVAGAMTPAGLGGSVIEMMERGLVDFIISSGANLYHDLHYALNFTLRRGSPFLNDVELYEDGVIRIYDVLFPATVLLETDQYIRDFIVRSGLNERIATSEFHYRLGRDLLVRFPGCEEHSVVARAALVSVPLYTPSPGDSSIGMNIAYHELVDGSRLMIDPNRDVNEVCAIVIGGLGWPVRRDASGGGQLGQSESSRVARHRRRVLRFDDCLPPVLRVRRGIAQRPAPAEGPRAQARRAGGVAHGTGPRGSGRQETGRP
jgi:deoxyhypusine synthase